MGVVKAKLCRKKQIFPRFIKELRTSQTPAKTPWQHNKKIPIITRGSTVDPLGNIQNCPAESGFSAFKTEMIKFTGRVGRFIPCHGMTWAAIE